MTTYAKRRFQSHDVNDFTDLHQRKTITHKTKQHWSYNVKA